MSLTIDNKTLRNLEEQVLKNKEDIAKHYQVDRVLADWGIKVIGVVATINDIPEGNYQYGDSYGLSSTSPMQYVIWTRSNPNVGQDTDYWLNVGALSLVGPQGAQGIQGIQGARGERGSKWTSSTSAPTATSGYNMGDQWLNTTTGDVYEFRGNTWARLGNIKGPQGVQGPIGPKGDQGIQGPTGSQGPKGDTGSSFSIAGLLNNAENLPTPTEANRHKGYAVKNADNVTYDLYVVVGEAGSLQWVNMGRVEGVEGPQGPVGPQGPAGADIQIVHITGIPSTATQGNLTQDQVNTLLAHPGNYIQFFNENFYPQDVEIGEGYIVYSHVGQIGNETKIKNINLTIATGSWVLTETSLVSAPITIVNELPEANEENFEKGKIYTTGELLQYISKKLVDTPNIQQINSLPNSLKMLRTVSIGDNIYILGGFNNSDVAQTTIYKFNVNSKTYSLMNSQLPSGLQQFGAAAVGNKIYICGGYANGFLVNKIYELDVNNDTITEKPTVMPVALRGCSVVSVGNFVYILGGFNNNANVTANVYKYSPLEATIVTSGSTNQYYAGGASTVIGENIYLIGGYTYREAATSQILKYSTITNTATVITSSLDSSTDNITATSIGDNIYILEGSKINSIDTLSDTKTLIASLGISLTNSSAVTNGDNIYFFGGVSGSATNRVYEVEFGYTFQYKTIATQ